MKKYEVLPKLKVNGICNKGNSFLRKRNICFGLGVQASVPGKEAIYSHFYFASIMCKSPRVFFSFKELVGAHNLVKFGRSFMPRMVGEDRGGFEGNFLAWPRNPAKPRGPIWYTGFRRPNPLRPPPIPPFHAVQSPRGGTRGFEEERKPRRRLLTVPPPDSSSTHRTPTPRRRRTSSVILLLPGGKTSPRLPLFPLVV